jgi:uncharacterized protein (TIGR02301 family)
MGRLAKPLALLLCGIFWAGTGTVAYAPSADAQFFRFFEQQKPKRRARPAPRRGYDLPKIAPPAEEALAPPPPDDRPYDEKLMRLAEILGAVHYLRELCGAGEGQLWRDEMAKILRNEGTTAVRRAKLVNQFNDGYRGYRQTYRTCTESATRASSRFSKEGAELASALSQTSVFASGPQAQVQPQQTPSTAGANTTRN